MIAYPIFKRELGRAARKPLLYWLRLGSVLIAVLAGVFLLKGGHTWPSGSVLGRELFERVTWPAFMLCLVSGVLLSSNLLCEERREGSLALLFLTRVKGLDVIVAKVGAVALLTSQIVMAVFPVIALCLVLGGVSGAEFTRMVQVLISTLLLSLALGILISALNRSMGRAALISFFAITLVTVALAFADAQTRAHLPPDPSSLVVPGPLQLFLDVPDLRFRLPPNGFKTALLAQYAITFAILLLAGSMLKRLSIGAEPIRTEKIKPRNYRAARGQRRRALHRNPIHWLVLRGWNRWLITSLLFAVLLSLWLGFLYGFANYTWCEPLAFFLFGPLLHLLFKIVVISEASDFFAMARREELELLLVSPLSTSGIILGHARALLRQVAWPAGMIFGADLFIVFLYKPHDPFEQNTVAYLLTFALGITMLVDLPALIWRGLWNGLRSPNALSALRRTFLEVLLLPVPFFLGIIAFIIWFGTVLLVPIANALGVQTAGEDSATVTGMIVLWWLVSFVLNTLLQRNARQNLNTWLRYLAANASSVIGPNPRRFLTVPPHFLPYVQATS